MATTTPLLLTLTLATAMARSFPRTVTVEREERGSLDRYGDVFATTECTNENDTCRGAGTCLLENSGFVCFCKECPAPQPFWSVANSPQICGEDGRTYESLCEYQREQCRLNRKIGIRHKLKCGDPCYEKRNQTKVLQVIGDMPYGYIPLCNEDNPSLYDVKQCNRTEKGLQCWCVHPDTNKNITEPRIVKADQNSDLNCDWEYKLTQLRCSPCIFVGEIITFAEKFSGTLQDIFLKFDINKDKYLDPSEIDIIARWLRLSKDCVRDTLLICDTNQNKKISHEEWCSCILNSFRCPQFNTPRNVNCST